MVNMLLIVRIYPCGMNDVRLQLGSRIRCLRVSQGLSQRSFALMIGMDRSYLIAVERGRRNVALDNIAKISSGLGVSMSELFDGVSSSADPADGRVADGRGART